MLKWLSSLSFYNDLVPFKLLNHIIFIIHFYYFLKYFFCKIVLLGITIYKSSFIIYSQVYWLLILKKYLETSRFECTSGQKPEVNCCLINNYCLASFNIQLLLLESIPKLNLKYLVNQWPISVNQWFII